MLKIRNIHVQENVKGLLTRVLRMFNYRILERGKKCTTKYYKMDENKQKAQLKNQTFEFLIYRTIKMYVLRIHLYTFTYLKKIYCYDLS